MSTPTETAPAFATDEPPGTLRATFRNVGGIDAARIDLPPGITVLVGENATNRSSTLRGIAATLGADVPAESLLGTDAEEGAVALGPASAEFDLSGSDHHPAVAGLELSRGTGGRVRRQRINHRSESSTEAVATNFVALFESNPIRRAIARGQTDTLYRHLMAPVDTERLDTKINELSAEREQTEERIRTLEGVKAELPSLEADLREAEAKIAELETELEAARERIEDVGTEVSDEAGVRDLVSRLESAKETLQQRENQLQRERNAIQSLEEGRDAVESELDAFEPPDTDPAEIDTRLTELQSRRSGIDDTVGELRRVLRFNRKVLETDEYDLFAGSDGAEAVPAALDPDGGTVECWTCGSSVETTAIRERLAEIERLVERKERELEQIEDEIAECRNKRDELEEAEQRREELEDELRTVEEELQRRRERVPELEADIDDLEAEIADLEADIRAARENRDSELLDAHQRVAELEAERRRAREERDAIRQQLDEREQRVEELDDLRRTREQLTARIEELRDRVATLEREVADRFNERMDAVLEIMDYDNLSRVWIERKTAGDDTDFELHIVRGGEAVYEDTIRTLSESEREVIGVMAAVAGYLAHDVGDDLPVMLLDSLEAIDARRIRDLLTYLAEETAVTYLITALLPEDAAAMPDSATQLEATEHLVGP